MRCINHRCELQFDVTADWRDEAWMSHKAMPIQTKFLRLYLSMNAALLPEPFSNCNNGYSFSSLRGAIDSGRAKANSMPPLLVSRYCRPSSS